MDVIKTVYLSVVRSKDPLYLNMHEQHLMLVKNFKNWTKKFQCHSCNRILSSLQSLRRHVRVCSNVTDFVYPGGYYKMYKSIFTELAEENIVVPERERFYDYFITYDFECALMKKEVDNFKKLKWRNQHKPISVSVCSNVPNYKEPKCFVDFDGDKLMSKMITYCREIRKKALSLLNKKWKNVDLMFKKLIKERYKELKEQEERETLEDIEQQHNERDLRESCRNDITEQQMIFQSSNCFANKDNFMHYINNPGSDRPAPKKANYFNESEVDEIGEEEEEEEVLKKKDPVIQRYVSLQYRFNRYKNSIPICGFNSSKYDILLDKEHLFKHLINVPEEEVVDNEGRNRKRKRDVQSDPESQMHVIKKANAYMSISTPEFKFLDILSYLPAGSSLDSFLKAFKCNQSKSYFPYEFLDHPSKLDAQNLPHYPNNPDWVSSLKANEDILDSEFQKYIRNGSKGEAPLTGMEKYNQLLHTWRSLGMKTMKDFLIYYNNLDVLPMVEAIEKMRVMYMDKNLDFLKCSISVPGLARITIMRHAQNKRVNFAIIDKDNMDLHFLMRCFTVGGPSIVFNRLHEKNVTCIRNNPQFKCASICGWDANSLYLYSLGKAMPTGDFIRRRAEHNFVPESRRGLIKMYQWIQYMEQELGVRISNGLSEGSECKVGKYPVDGLASLANDRKTVFQFDGCWAHGHDCSLTKHVTKDAQWRDRALQTIERDRYIKQRGYEVVCIKECEFEQLCLKRPDIKSFVSQNSKFTRLHKGAVKESIILEGVKSGTLFGFALVDIEIPEKWEEGFQQDLPPAEYFAEMAPLFVTTEVPFEHFGELSNVNS